MTLDSEARDLIANLARELEAQVEASYVLHGLGNPSHILLDLPPNHLPPWAKLLRHVKELGIPY